MDKLVPAEYHKWLPLSRKYASRFVGISIAWWLARLVSALHSAVRGATLVVSGVTGYVIRHGYVDKRISKVGIAYIAMALAMAAQMPVCERAIRCWGILITCLLLQHAGIFQLLMLAIALVGFWMQLRGACTPDRPVGNCCSHCVQTALPG